MKIWYSNQKCQSSSSKYSEIQCSFEQLIAAPLKPGISLLCGTTESIRTCTSTSNEIAVASSLATIN
ncbi:Uncharacterized protein BM_BM9564 [Brugia malayi]|uniref:Bm9564 n=1 Tax=Brugia malayi TaxID=6279 RepID=A0A0I9N7P7_BRUMA|nr:Uncharacterized protein BM_BM9564 [Brugia malayi]CTP81184.1 Bm9564 [Brugia malayi]VIO88921.1 Uncharacterized protein BM_BM9564 [Brugia malayi]